MTTEHPRRPHQGQPVLTAGTPFPSAAGALVLVHGRGATASSILELQSVLRFPNLAYVAPQAAGNTWYPYSFLAPTEQNEPGLSSGLQALSEAIAMLEVEGIPASRIIIAGFSQGACLASEFVARNAKRYGGLIVFSGGVIGPPGIERSYEGSLDETPVFLGCGDPDPHIPRERVDESAAVFETLNGRVTRKIYPGIGHTIVPNEIEHANAVIATALTND